MSKDPKQILRSTRPVPLLSDNVADLIIKKVQEVKYDILIEYGSGNSTRFFLEYLLQLKKKMSFFSIEYKFSWFEEMVRLIRSDLRSRISFREELELEFWDYQKCKRYFYGNNASSLDIPGDLKKLPSGKKAFRGPLNIKMLLYRLNERSRPQDGYYSIMVDNSIEFLLLLRAEFMKDQYGESPIKKEYIDAPLNPIRQRLSSGETISAAFLIDGGPRGDIMNSIFDMEDEYSGFYPTIFLCEAHRSYYADPISRRSSGYFIKGTNRTLDGAQVYRKTYYNKFVYGKTVISPEEMAERELWVYESSPEHAN
jgi:hypothetical protein